MSKRDISRILFVVSISLFSVVVGEIPNVKYKIHMYDVYYEELFEKDIRPLQHDCVYYDIVDTLLSTRTTYTWSNQLTIFCFRPDNRSLENPPIYPSRNPPEPNIATFTFVQLKEKSISSSQLFEWSASIDIIENYQAYLDGDLHIDLNNSQNSFPSEYIFYNCTLPWFGSRCQYIFSAYLNSLEDYIFAIYTMEYHYFTPELSCYIHLTCNRDLMKVCLDWREICDERADCRDGEDERECAILEENLCNEDEFRCHNGQCIPLTFYRDDSLNPDCMDGTDEPMNSENNKRCYIDLAFRCEDTSCYSQMYSLQPYSCGDGQCSPFGHDCQSERYKNTDYPPSPIPWGHLDPFCFYAMTCIADTAIVPELCNCIGRFGESCASIMKYECPPDLFIFPRKNVVLGYINYIYDTKKYDRFKNVITPMYICFNEVNCQLNKSIIQYNILNYTCINYDNEFGMYFSEYPGWDQMTTFIQNYFLDACPPVKKQCAHSSLYLCNYSSKCISKQRLYDRVPNCPSEDDETVINSCSFFRSDVYRFKCSRENICFSTLILNNGVPDCGDGEDELDPRQRYIENNIMFKFICDGIVDMLPINISGEHVTDETNCEQWNCSNTLTRCNSVWNCPNGEDELGCDNLEIHCSPLHRPCFSPSTMNLTCLPIEKFNDGIMDCLGGSDERDICRKAFPQSHDKRYFCWNMTQCVEIQRIRSCNTDMDNVLADVISDSLQCYRKNLSIIQRHFCNLRDGRNYDTYEISLSNRTELQFEKHYKSNEISSNHRFRIARQDIDSPEQLCHRGIKIMVASKDDIILKCLCPPSLYGDRCEYQSQRVSLTVQAQSSSDWREMFTFIFILLTDNNEIESYDHRYYSPSTDCAIKWNIYLLYRSRPKDPTRNHSVRVDIYRRQITTVEYRASWYYPIKFSFLPVYRLAIKITIPSRVITSQSADCTIDCGTHGSCIIMNSNTKEAIARCRCDTGWIGSQCQDRQTSTGNCSCAPGSVCISSYPKSICVCPLGRGGSRCYIKLDPCQHLGECLNGGQCVPDDERKNALFVKRCVCPEDFWGVHCEFPLTKFIVTIHPKILLSSLITLHLIEDKQERTHQHLTTFKRIFPYETTVIVRATMNKFDLIFIEFNHQYYSTDFIRNNSYEILMSVLPEHRCLSIGELFNSTFAKLDLIHRIKYYQIPCQKYSNLSCFYDDIHMCACDTSRFAICVLFEHNRTHSCQNDSGNCENGGKCFQDHAQCPTKFACLCLDCFYGSKCQFSSEGFSLSLDSIIGYQIRPEKNLSEQLFAVKFCVIFTVIMFLVGMVNGIVSSLVFKSKEAQKIGCGLYLFTTSLFSIVIVIILTLKITFLLLAQMTYITNVTFLHIQCRTIDYILRTCLSFTDWLSACVAIERVFIVLKKTNFDTTRSKQIAKYVIIFLFIANAISNVYEAIFRRIIIDDGDNEERIWCVVSYPLSVQRYSVIIQFIHFLTPFICNILSALIVLQKITRGADKKLVRKQLKQHKHLVISPIILVLLASPRLVISLVLDCMKADRNPWIFLAGYFISFIPSLLIFVVFILPSTIYKNEWKKLLKISN